VTDEKRAMLSADDAELLKRVWAGDTAAFQVIYQRHEHAARRLARDLVVTADEVDEVVAETFDQLLEITRRGGGPADAFRPYLLTAVLRVCERRRAEPPMTSSDDLADPAEPYIDLAVAGHDDPLIVRAFLSLPERWMAVLWHTEIEGASPAEVAPLLGLSRNGVAALRRRARDGLTRAYLQMYSAGAAAGECTTLALGLGAFIRDAVSGPESAAVTEHLNECDDCRAVFAELSDVSMALRAIVAPVFLGDWAAYYLSGTAPGAKARTASAPQATTTAADGTAGVAAGAAWWLRPRGLVRDTARPLRWLVAGGAAVIALGAIAFAMAGHGTPLKPADRNQAQAPASSEVRAAGSQASSTLGQPSSTPGNRSSASARSTTAPAAVPASASRNAPVAPSASPPGSTSPARPPGSSPPRSPSPSPSSAVRLTASVDVHGGRHHSNVFFQVSDTGSAGTGELTVSVALPAGSSLLTGSQGDGGDAHVSDHPGQHGWSCTATSSGALCSHGPIPAGGQSWGMIFIAIDASSACGQTVSVTASSGSASASAESPEDIQC
jgi:DNA-directed RNA polymerase specialized sigma24 family protein